MISVRGMKKVFSIAFTSAIVFALIPTNAYAKNDKGGKITTVKTVDSSEKGVNLQVFDYAKRANIGGKGYVSGDGRIEQGLLSNVLAKDGFPVVKSNGLSLKEWYSEKGSGVKKSYLNCNHLFSKEVFDKTGYLTYSSFTNFAELESSGKSSDDHNFKVYEQLGTPSNDSPFYYKRGNFFPFNSIKNAKESSNQNLYNMDGQKLDSSDSRYKETLYKIDNPNYYFGMYLSTGFNMLKDGQYNGSDMVYEFNGDDDLWIYIDGILVLDIGGIHDAHSGKINFATGEICEDTSSQKSESKNVTTLRQRFIDAGVDTDMIKKLFGDKNTFVDGSSHVFKMFYMERGAGASNCYIKFNLTTMPEEKVELPDDIVDDNKIPVTDEPSKDKPVTVEEPKENEDKEKNDTTEKVDTKKETEKVDTKKETEKIDTKKETEKVDTKKETTKKESSKKETPKTGDTANFVIFISIAVVSLGIAGVMMISRKRKRLE